MDLFIIRKELFYEKEKQNTFTIYSISSNYDSIVF